MGSGGHLAHHVSDPVDALDLGAFYAPYEGDGRRNRPYDPRMMVKVLLYGNATGVFSSRKLSRKLEEDVALRMLAAGNFPRHRRCATSGRRTWRCSGALFAEVVRLARELGLAELGRVAVDGTKVRANASKRKAMSHGRMGPRRSVLEEEIAELLAAAEAADAAEDARYGEDVRGDELPEELKRREIVWRRSGRRRRAWRRRRGSGTRRGPGSRSGSGIRRGGRRTSWSTGSRRRRLRATSRIRRAGS